MDLNRCARNAWGLQLSLIGRRSTKNGHDSTGEVIGKIDEFVRTSEIAAEIGVAKSTIKKTVKESKVTGVKWGRDRNGVVMVHRESVVLIHRHFTEVRRG